MRQEVPEDLAAKAEAVLHPCDRSHSFEQSKDAGGSSTNGVLGRKIAGTNFNGINGHSDALHGMPGRWDREKLAALLSDPKVFAPGTTMPPTNLEKGPLLEALIQTFEYINTVDDKHLRYN